MIKRLPIKDWRVIEAIAAVIPALNEVIDYINNENLNIPSFGSEGDVKSEPANLCPCFSTGGYCARHTQSITQPQPEEECKNCGHTGGCLSKVYCDCFCHHREQERKEKMRKWFEGVKIPLTIHRHKANVSSTNCKACTG